MSNYDKFVGLGMSVPMKPIDTVHTTLSFELAEIRWLVPVVIYTPENYTVVYGRDQTLLNYSSDEIVGSSNITDTNLMYLAILRGLEPNTTYYYRVIARNT